MYYKIHIRCHLINYNYDINYIAQYTSCSRLIYCLSVMQTLENGAIHFLNNDTQSLCQVWRKVERQWKEDKLQVSYDVLKD